MSIPLVEVTHAVEFAAAHRLAAPDLTAEQNAARYGRCAREHGHTFGLEVTVLGPVDPATGMVIDFAVLRRIVDERVIAAVDHRHLDRDVPFLAGRISTAENLAVAIWRELEPAVRTVPGCRLRRIAVAEDRDHHVEYRGAERDPTAG